MKIKLITDLHNEMRRNVVPYTYNGEEVVLVGGDIDVHAGDVFDYLNEIANYPVAKVLFVYGNHEFYHQDMAIMKAKLGLLCENHPKIHILDPGAVTYQDVTFIGATLWTNFNDRDWFAMHAAKDRINDFARIMKREKRVTPDMMADMYDQDWGYIKHMLGEPCGRKVVLTHFLPALECVAERFKGTGVINHYFANNLGEEIAARGPEYWFHGHTHDPVDIALGNTRIIAAPTGYPGEHQNQTTWIGEI